MSTHKNKDFFAETLKKTQWLYQFLHLLIYFCYTWPCLTVMSSSSSLTMDMSQELVWFIMILINP